MEGVGVYAAIFGALSALGVAMSMLWRVLSYSRDSDLILHNRIDRETDKREELAKEVFQIKGKVNK